MARVRTAPANLGAAIAQARASLVIDTLLLASLALYALFSYPFPVSPGAVEALVGMLLATYVIGTTWWRSVSRSGANDRLGVPLPLMLTIAYLICGPLLSAVFSGNQAADIQRDLVPLLYLLLPALVYPSLPRHASPAWSRTLPWALVAAGVVISMRFFVAAGAMPWQVGTRLLSDGLLYFSFDPSVMFAALFLLLWGMQRFEVGGWHNVVKAAISFLLALLPLAALIGVVQRAPLTLIPVTLGLAAVPKLRHRPVALAFALCGLLALSVAFGQTLLNTIEIVNQKTDAVGDNSKLDELAAVTATISASPQTLLFGLGWGGTYMSPAVGNAEVRFVHSLVGFTLLKTGILGAIAMIAYLGWIAKQSWPGRGWTQPAWLAIPPTLAIGLFVQVNYKTLTFGMLLMLWLSLGFRRPAKQTIGTPP